VEKKQNRLRPSGDVALLFPFLLLLLIPIDCKITYACVVLMKQVSPNSGPYQGGTNVKMSGTDLGVIVDDIFSITIGGAPCVIYRDSYSPGER